MPVLFGTISVWEILLLLLTAGGLIVHSRALRNSLLDRRALRAQGLNGARRLLVRGHIRGHASRLLMSGAVLALTLYLMTRAAPPTDRSAPVAIMTLLVITTTLLMDGLLDAADWRRLEEG